MVKKRIRIAVDFNEETVKLVKTEDVRDDELEGESTTAIEPEEEHNDEADNDQNPEERDLSAYREFAEGFMEPVHDLREYLFPTFSKWDRNRKIRLRKILDWISRRLGV